MVTAACVCNENKMTKEDAVVANQIDVVKNNTDGTVYSYVLCSAPSYSAHQDLLNWIIDLQVYHDIMRDAGVE